MKNLRDLIEAVDNNPSIKYELSKHEIIQLFKNEKKLYKPLNDNELTNLFYDLEFFFEEELKLPHEEIAKMLGVSKSTVKHVSSGTRRIKLKKIKN